MKKLLVIFSIFLFPIIIHGQQIFTVTNVGTTFSPSELNVSQGDIVRFNLSAGHPVLEVSQATWNANGTTPLQGGFSFPSGVGDYVASTTGTHYFVCTAHVSLGMKGSVVVSVATGINDIQINSDRIYPNPAEKYIIYESSKGLLIKEIRILDIIGNTVKIISKPEFSDGQIRIDIEDLNKGIYVIRVKSDKETIAKKFLKS